MEEHGLLNYPTSCLDYASSVRVILKTIILERIALVELFSRSDSDSPSLGARNE